MICVDTSSLLAFWQGDVGRDSALVDRAFADELLMLSPVIVTEVLSSPNLLPLIEEKILRIPLLEITAGYWRRAGKLRAQLLRRRYRPKIADTLIAQSCLDYRVPLITRDTDFAAFEKVASLRLL